jgi:hypothetical protein
MSFLAAWFDGRTPLNLSELARLCAIAGGFGGL